MTYFCFIFVIFFLKIIFVNFIKLTQSVPQLFLIFQYPLLLGNTPTACTQWSISDPQTERTPPVYDDHEAASTQTERGPVL